jgi:single-strand DNA-binding protein
MARLNKVFLMGNLTRDPELRYTPSGSAVTDLGLAVNRSWTGKDGERKEETLFIDVTVWDRQAENCCQYLKKGRAVHIEGSLKMDEWVDKTTGDKRTKIKVLADIVQFLDSRRDEAGGGVSEGEYAPAREPQVRRPPSGPSNGPGRGGYPTAAGSPDRRPAPSPEPEGDDDIPF